MASRSGQDEAARPLLGNVTTDNGATSDVTYGTDAPVAAAESVAGAVPRDQAQGQGQGQGTFKRNLGALDAFAIIISIVIGSGIFTSPGSIDTNVPAPGWALVVWLVGGALAWTGAGTMAELGTAIPGEGGVQPYLKYIYGDLAGFLAAWTWVLAIMPATLAILSIVFVESIFSAAGVTDQAASLSHKLLSVLIMVLMNLCNSISTKASTRLNNFFVALKFLSIFGVVLAGIVVLIIQLADPSSSAGGGDWRRKSWFDDRDTVTPEGGLIHWQDVSTWEMLGHFSAALYGALWAYSGWEKGIYVSAELSNPIKQLPLAINTAVPTIILCFLATNAAYYILLPWDVVSTTDSVAVVSSSSLATPRQPLRHADLRLRRLSLDCSAEDLASLPPCSSAWSWPALSSATLSSPAAWPSRPRTQSGCPKYSPWSGASARRGPGRRETTRSLRSPGRTPPSTPSSSTPSCPRCSSSWATSARSSPSTAWASTPSSSSPSWVPSSCASASPDCTVLISQSW